MKLLSRKDVGAALATGFTTGIIAWLILAFLGRELPFHISAVVLVPVIPVLWIFGVQLGYVLAGISKSFEQFGRFAATGFANAMVDFGVLYFLIAISGIATGGMYALFKGISFSIAVAHSYFWNKYWVFDAGKQATTPTEAATFFAVSVASLLINVAGAFLVVKAGPIGTLDAKAWAGVGAVVGSAISLIFNFFGLKLFVFRKK